jgi:hypothetical protein
MASILEKGTAVPTVWENGWASGSVWVNFGEKEHFFPLPKIEPRFCGSPVFRLVITPTTLSQVPRDTTQSQFDVL